MVTTQVNDVRSAKSIEAEQDKAEQVSRRERGKNILSYASFLLPLGGATCILLVMIFTNWLLFDAPTGKIDYQSYPYSQRYAPLGSPSPDAQILFDHTVHFSPKMDDIFPVAKNKEKTSNEEYWGATGPARLGSETRWVAFAILQDVVSLTAFTVGAAIVLFALKSLLGYSAKVTSLLTCFFILFAVAICEYFPYGAVFTIWGSGWLQTYTIGQTPHGWENWDPIGRSWRLEGLTILAGVLLVLAFGTTLLPSSSTKAESLKDNDSEKRRDIAKRMMLCRVVLFSGTALLVVAILQTSFFYQWALDYLFPRDNEVYRGMQSFASSIVTIYGVIYSLLLAGSYLPTFLLLTNRAFQLLPPDQRTKPFPQQFEWLKSEGLILDTGQLILRAVSILGPILVSSLSELIKNVAQKGG